MRIKNNKWYLIIFTIIFVFSYLVLKFIPKQQFQIESVVFPSATNNPQYALDYGMRFGDERELNELLVVMNSEDVLIELVKDLKLTEKFEVSSEKAAVKILQENLSISRTLNRSLNISFFDENPDFGIKLMESYFHLVWLRQSKLMFNNLYQQKDTLELLATEKTKDINAIKDSMTTLENEGALKVVGLTVLKSTKYRFLERKFEMEVDRYAEIAKQQETLNQIIRKGIPKFHIVSGPVASLKPVKPKKLFVSSMISLAVILLLILFNNREKIVLKNLK